MGVPLLKKNKIKDLTENCPISLRHLLSFCRSIARRFDRQQTNATGKVEKVVLLIIIIIDELGSMINDPSPFFLQMLIHNTIDTHNQKGYSRNTPFVIVTIYSSHPSN